MTQAFLGLGSNLGDRAENIKRAIDLLAKNPQVRIVQVSSLIETEPVGYTEQPDFMNAAAHIETTLKPRELLKVVLEIENNLGRERTIRWGPRVIDIDILLYDDQHIEEDDLQIPHPRMMERSFVLIPLAEIAPDIRLPNGRTAAQTAEQSRRDIESDT